MNYDFKLAEKALEKEFEQVNEIRDYNQRKVLKAFFDTKLHRNTSTQFPATVTMTWAEKFWIKFLRKYFVPKKHW